MNVWIYLCRWGEYIYTRDEMICDFLFSGTQRLFKAGINGKQWNYLAFFFVLFFCFLHPCCLNSHQVVALAMHSWGWEPLITLALVHGVDLILIGYFFFF